jgi:hypothetical protein
MSAATTCKWQKMPSKVKNNDISVDEKQFVRKGEVTVAREAAFCKGVFRDQFLSAIRKFLGATPFCRTG